jgi:cytochrome P450
MMRDPRIWGEYGKLDEFDPDRFIPEINPGASKLPDTGMAFGFGRRYAQF